MTIPALLRCDAYKLSHADQYPDGTEAIYSNFTPRSNKHLNVPEEYKDDYCVFFGIEAFMTEFYRIWKETFFDRPFDDVIEEFAIHTKSFCPVKESDVTRLRKLHEYGSLPLNINYLPEGSIVPMRVPVMTIENYIDEDFYWLTNSIETWLSADLWKVCTVATIARYYKKIVTKYAKLTSDNTDFVDYQCHDFSTRGMSGIEDSGFSGMGHLLFFKGSDNVPAYYNLRKYYSCMGMDFNDSGFDGMEGIGSVPATEHSVMCAGGKESELDTFRRLMKVYPTGTLSIVSDTWDFFKVINDFTRILKDEILERDGTIIFRPDSGNPVDIICGDESYDHGTPEQMGALECLWDVFGGSINSKGYRVLNNKVRLIYGDSITLEIADKMLNRMQKNGFSSENIVLGVGSYSYQFLTRDTLGFAMKATNSVINGESIAIFKSPKTDNGVKKSARGLINVYEENGKLVLYDEQECIDPDSLLIGCSDHTDSYADIKKRANKEFL